MGNCQVCCATVKCMGSRRDVAAWTTLISSYLVQTGWRPGGHTGVRYSTLWRGREASPNE
jgi:hypothetical protein